MSAPHRAGRWSDQQVEQAIGNLLRIGLLMATMVVVIGAAIYLSRHGGEQPDYHVFYGTAPDLRGIGGIVHDAIGLSGRGLIQLGLVLLLATPVARVVFSIIAFMSERDHLYVGVTALVLGVLLYSLLRG